MKKSLLASAIALSVGSAASVQAQTITITQMKFSGTPYVASGTLNSNGGGVMNSVENFFKAPWVADQQTWITGPHDGSVITWSGTGTSTDATNAYANFTYTFTMSSNQVAVGTYFDWAGNNNIPVLTIFSCGQTGPSVCKGKSLPMATAPFPGANPKFNGTTNDNFAVSGAVPVPAAVWLMGSGLLGLVGVARRRKVA